MKLAKKCVAQLLLLVLIANLFAVPAFADSPFIDNTHWKEVSATEVNNKYTKDDSFVVMFFRTSCSNSQMRRVMVNNWMTKYNLDVYGVDVDKYGIPTWVWNGLGKTNVSLPVICIVEKGKADCFDAQESMRSIQKRLQEYLGIYDESAIDFSNLYSETCSAYSTNFSTASAMYCIPLSEIASDIQNEAKNIVSSATSDRQKVKAIYDWVTTNIAYNYGMLNGTVSYKTSALETYTNRNSVCSGYANLTAAMCSAVGIPCRVVTGFATGVEADSTVGDVWSLYDAYLKNGDLKTFMQRMTPYENHAWNEAYVDGEWIILDTTWGSNNDYYPDKNYTIKGTPTDEYFDPDLEWFSESHLFWTDYSSDFTVTLSNGKLKASAALGQADVNAASYLMMASYDANGKMLECVTLKPSGTSISQTLTQSSNAKSVKIFLVNKNYVPVSPIYFGKVLI